MTEEAQTPETQVALFRYGLIADCAQLPKGKGNDLVRKLAEKASQHYAIPQSRRTRVAVETMRDWIAAYRNGGFDALKPKKRKDAGSARKLPQDVTHDERDLYFFLLLAADRRGVSFYHYDSICAALECSLDTYLAARNGLIDKDLIAFDGSRFQVLSLPERPRLRSSPPLRTRDDLELHDPATIARLVDDKPR